MPSVAKRQPKRGRPSLGKKAKAHTLGVRVNADFLAALERRAKKERRDVTEMARLFIGERLIDDGDLPPDFEL